MVFRWYLRKVEDTEFAKSKTQTSQAFPCQRNRNKNEKNKNCSVFGWREGCDRLLVTIPRILLLCISARVWIYGKIYGEIVIFYCVHFHNSTPLLCLWACMCPLGIVTTHVERQPTTSTRTKWIQFAQINDCDSWVDTVDTRTGECQKWAKKKW